MLWRSGDRAACASTRLCDPPTVEIVASPRHHGMAVVHARGLRNSGFRSNAGGRDRLTALRRLRRGGAQHADDEKSVQPGEWPTDGLHRGHR